MLEYRRFQDRALRRWGEARRSCGAGRLLLRLGQWRRGADGRNLPAPGRWSALTAAVCDLADRRVLGAACLTFLMDVVQSALRENGCSCWRPIPAGLRSRIGLSSKYTLEEKIADRWTLPWPWLADWTAEWCRRQLGAAGQPLLEGYEGVWHIRSGERTETADRGESGWVLSAGEYIVSDEGRRASRRDVAGRSAVQAGGRDMRKQKSIRWFRYTVEDAKAAQAELDEQAERGWELEEVGLFTATFRRAERPRRCWVEPARWKSERKKDWMPGWTIRPSAGRPDGSCWKRTGDCFTSGAKEGGDPLNSDRQGYGVELRVEKGPGRPGVEPVLSCRLLVHLDRRGYIREHPRMWELFLSNISMAMATLVLLWLGMDLFFVVRVLRYRAKCRRVVARGSLFPYHGGGEPDSGGYAR